MSHLTVKKSSAWPGLEPDMWSFQYRYRWTPWHAPLACEVLSDERIEKQKNQRGDRSYSHLQDSIGTGTALIGSPSTTTLQHSIQAWLRSKTATCLLNHVNNRQTDICSNLCRHVHVAPALGRCLFSIFKLARIISQGTVGVSFGASRELAFKHVASGSLLYFPQTNGMLFFFGRDVNIRWQHLGWYIIIWGLRWWFNMRTCLKFFYSGLNRERQFEAHVPLKALCKCTGIDIECVCQWEPGRLAEGETAPEHFIQSSSYCVPSCPVCAGPARYGLPFVMLPLPPWLLPTTAATATASSCCCCYYYCNYYASAGLRATTVTTTNTAAA